MESAAYVVQGNGTHTDSTTGVRYKVKAGEVITMQRAVNLGLAGAHLGVVATPDGTGTGAVRNGTEFAEVTSDSADKIATLPDAPVGTVVCLVVGATGYELRSHAPATVGINGGTGVGAESAIAANMRTVCQRTTSTNWLCHDTASDGTVTVSEVAAP